MLSALFLLFLLSVAEDAWGLRLGGCTFQRCWSPSQEEECRVRSPATPSPPTAPSIEFDAPRKTPHRSCWIWSSQLYLCRRHKQEIRFVKTISHSCFSSSDKTRHTISFKRLQIRSNVQDSIRNTPCFVSMTSLTRETFLSPPSRDRCIQAGPLLLDWWRASNRSFRSRDWWAEPSVQHKCVRTIFMDIRDMQVAVCYYVGLTSSNTRDRTFLLRIGTCLGICGMKVGARTSTIRSFFAARPCIDNQRRDEIVSKLQTEKWPMHTVCIDRSPVRPVGWGGHWGDVPPPPAKKLPSFWPLKL